MKRLAYFLRHMNNDTATYTEMYNGEIKISGNNILPYIDYDATYYDGIIGYSISTTHKLAQDKPTITINIPVKLLKIEDRSLAVADFALREFLPLIDRLNIDLYNRSRPDNENGKYYIHHPNGEILLRNSSYFSKCPQKYYENLDGNNVKVIDSDLNVMEMCLCIKVQLQLPKKKIKKAIQMLCKDLPEKVRYFINNFNYSKMDEIIELSKKQQRIREWLKTSKEYCAFIANGSLLPRSKDSDMPLENAVPFISPLEDEIEIDGTKGMGIKRGVTVITGGGYSGKSTILNAISVGIYDHILGDGRELCITDSSAVTVSAEDGRNINNVNISPFIKWLPQGNVYNFSTEHASGSTSQAANIMEAIECGTRLLLIDEDKSATNFMIRDKLMKRIISRDPITPFTERVQELWKKLKISTILVIGGSSEYISVADKIYLVENYKIQNKTDDLKKLINDSNDDSNENTNAFWENNRALITDRFSSYPSGSGSEKLEVIDAGIIIMGDELVDTRGINNILTKNQLYALGFMMRYLATSINNATVDFMKKIDELYYKIDCEGLDLIYSTYFTNSKRFLDLPRKTELIFAINRMKQISFKNNGGNID